MKGRTEDRRRSRRMGAEQVFAAFKVQGLAGSDQAFGVVRDVSETGVRIETPQPPVVPSTVLLRISVGEDVFELTMQVRRVHAEGNGVHIVGMDFLRLDAQRTRFLERFLEDGRFKPR